MQITIEGTKDLERSLKGAERKMPQQLNSAINKTLTFTQSRKAKEIAQRLNMTQKNIKKNLRKIKSTKTTLTAISRLVATKQPSLKDFRGTKQNKTGVSFQIDKSKNKTTLKGGFMGPKPGQVSRKLNGHAFIRAGYPGGRRKPIIKLKGISPWAIYVFNKMDPAMRKQVQERLAKEIQNKIRVNILRSQGLI